MVDRKKRWNPIVENGERLCAESVDADNQASRGRRQCRAATDKTVVRDKAGDRWSVRYTTVVHRTATTVGQVSSEIIAKSMLLRWCDT